MDIKNKYSGVSVIICCYNSASRINTTLEHLYKQLVPTNFFWEIIVVDNASTDDTASVVNNSWKTYKPQHAVCRIIYEPTPGQMHARKTGALNATYECLVFCDDDNLLEENYVFLSHEVIFKQEGLGAAGGQNFPVTDAGAYPSWFKEFRNYYAIGIPADKSGDITARGFVLGAGMITKRSCFLSVFSDKYPSLLSGRNGEQLTTGDDFEYCKRLLLWDYRFYYDERLKLNHFIPKERLTIDYRCRLMEGIIQSQEILSEYDFIIGLKNKLSEKNKIKLILLTPVRVLLTRLGLSKRKPEYEKNVLAYLFPFSAKTDPVKTAIIKFAKQL